MEKIKGSNVRHAIFDYLHTMMFMSINPDETINDFKACGREMVVESFDNYNLVLLGQDIFGLIIANSINKRFPFQVWHVIKPFCYKCITSYMFIFHTFKLYHALKVCCACPCRALDGWDSSGAALESRHTS
jgi:hypothetical protein